MFELIDKGDTRSPRPPLLFVHGARHTAMCWDEHLLDFFADRGYRAIALDLHRAGHSIDDYVDRVHTVAAQLPSAPILVGHATGGFIVQQYLHRYRAPAAVLLASTPSRAYLMAMMHGSRLRDLLFGATTPESLIERCFASMDDAEVRALCPDPTEMAAPLRPRLRVVGASDRLAPLLALYSDRGSWGPAVAQSLARDHHARVEFLPGTCHDMMLEPGWTVVSERIHRWLNALQNSTITHRWGSTSGCAHRPESIAIARQMSVLPRGLMLRGHQPEGLS